MPNQYYFSKSELESRLADSIRHWNPALPRRWLYRYGHLNDYARRSPQYARYHALRAAALTKTNKGTVRFAQKWPEGGFRLML